MDNALIPLQDMIPSEMGGMEQLPIITVNGAVAGQCDLISGSSETIQFQASDGDLIKLGWLSGSYDYEISWDVKDGGNNTIAMGIYGDVGVGAGACPAAIPCAALDYGQDFETGGALMTATSASGSSVGLDATSANVSLYGVHMQGNTSSSCILLTLLELGLLIVVLLISLQ